MTIHSVLNLGAGTQSSVLYLMMCRGEMPRADVAVFADTQAETQDVYAHLDWLEVEGGGRVPIVRTSAGNLTDDSLLYQRSHSSPDGKRWASIPLYVPGGMQNRQCTKYYKIIVVRNWVKRNLLALPEGESVRPGTALVHMIFGIHFDERDRMKLPDVGWIENAYPLVDWKWRRQQPINWAEKNYPGRTFPQSACFQCPYRNNYGWRRMRDERPDDFAKACAFDEQARELDIAAGGGGCYVHPSLKPLRIANLDDDADALLWGGMHNECEGMCGV